MQCIKDANTHFINDHGLFLSTPGVGGYAATISLVARLAREVERSGQRISRRTVKRKAMELKSGVGEAQLFAAYVAYRKKVAARGSTPRRWERKPKSSGLPQAAR